MIRKLWKPFEIFGNRSISSKIFEILRNISIYLETIRYPRISLEIFRNLLLSFQILKNLLTSLEMFKNLSKFSEFFRNLQKSLVIFRKIKKPFKIFNFWDLIFLRDKRLSAPLLQRCYRHIAFIEAIISAVETSFEIVSIIIDTSSAPLPKTFLYRFRG